MGKLDCLKIFLSGFFSSDAEIDAATMEIFGWRNLDSISASDMDSISVSDTQFFFFFFSACLPGFKKLPKPLLTVF